MSVQTQSTPNAGVFPASLSLSLAGVPHPLHPSKGPAA